MLLKRIRLLTRSAKLLDPYAHSVLYNAPISASPDRSGKRYSVRRQGFWNQWQHKLRERLAHLVGFIMRRAGDDASVALRVSFV